MKLPPEETKSDKRFPDMGVLNEMAEKSGAAGFARYCKTLDNSNLAALLGAYETAQQAKKQEPNPS